MNFILLGAGYGRRMGGNKALMEFQGKPWILFQLQQIIAAGFQKITLVTNPDAEAALQKIISHTLPPVKLLVNPNPENGPFSSLQLAIAAVPEREPSFVSPVDIPLRATTLKALHQAWLQSSLSTDALIPSYREKKGHPVILSAALQTSLLKLSVEAPEARLDFVLKALPENKKRIFAVEDPFITLDLNTPEDFSYLTSPI